MPAPASRPAVVSAWTCARLCAKVRRPRGRPQCAPRRFDRPMPGESLSSELVSAETAEALDRRFVFHTFTKLDDHPSSPAPVIVSGEGSTLRGTRGRTYRDAMGGLWCVNVGYGRRQSADALPDKTLRL